jgi:hypothetical protein
MGRVEEIAKKYGIVADIPLSPKWRSILENF